MRIRMALMCVALMLAPSLASAQVTAEAKCRNISATATDTDAVEAMNKALWMAATKARRALAKDCEPVSISGVDRDGKPYFAKSNVANYGGLCVTTAGSFGLSFRKTSEEIASLVALDYCRKVVDNDLQGGCSDEACIKHAKIASDELDQLDKPFTGKGWIAGMRCREGDGFDGKARRVLAGSDVELVPAIKQALQQGGTWMMSECRFRAFLNASSGERHPVPRTTSKQQ